jgi:hypothetical protein
MTMPNYQAISSDRHARKRWNRYSSYAFAASDAVIPLSAVELPKAVMSMPIGFIKQAECFVPVAVLGLQTGKNLFVAQNGSWSGSYIPAVFRAYPFRLAKTEEGKGVLCIDEDCGLVTTGLEGEAFFSEDGQPAPAIRDILNFLMQLEQSRLITTTACAALQKHQLICPWTITLKTEAGEQQVNGLFQVDEAALNALSGEDLLEVRQAGAMPMIYCQLLSKQHLPLLAQLAEAHAKAAAQALALQSLAPDGELNLEFFNNSGTISFAGLL